jgi:hypothetical protein
MPCGQEIRMTDENKPAAEDQAVDAVQLQTQLKEALDRIEAMDRKNNELLEEKKKKSEAARIAEEELEKEKLRKSGELDKLLEMEQEKTRAAIKEKEDLLNRFKTEKVKSLAAALANEMRGRPESIRVLTKCIVEEISDLVDENGELSKTKKEIVIQNFKDSTEYKPMLLGNQSTGGGAEGSSNTNFKDLTADEQVKLYKEDPNKWRQWKAASGK